MKICCYFTPLLSHWFSYTTHQKITIDQKFSLIESFTGSIDVRVAIQAVINGPFINSLLFNKSFVLNKNLSWYWTRSLIKKIQLVLELFLTKRFEWRCCCKNCFCVAQTNLEVNLTDLRNSRASNDTPLLKVENGANFLLIASSIPSDSLAIIFKHSQANILKFFFCTWKVIIWSLICRCWTSDLGA